MRTLVSKSSVIVFNGKPSISIRACLEITVLLPVYAIALDELRMILTSLEKKSCSFGIVFSANKLN